MKFLFLLATLCVFTTASAQSLTDLLFTKYSNKNGVSISTDDISLPKESTDSVPLSMTVRTLTIDNEDEEKRINRLMRQILRDCSKILNQKDYLSISIDKDDETSHKVYKYQSGNVTEIFDIEQEEGQLKLTVMRVIGTSKEMNLSYKIQTSKGLVDSSIIQENAPSNKASQ